MTCKECIHYDMCDYLPDDSTIVCEYFKNKSKFIELPFAFGDFVYPVHNGKIFRCRANAISAYLGLESLKIVVKCIIFDGICVIKEFEYGKNLFLTKEEAKARLKELESEHNDE